MMRHLRAKQWAATLSLGLALTACGSASTLTIRPTTPTDADLVPTPALEAHIYKRILVLSPDGAVEVAEDVEPTIVREQETKYFVNKVEKKLLSSGFEVISPEIVARAAKGTNTKYSSAERALIMGKETRADAVFMVQSIRVLGGNKFFHIVDMAEVQPGLREQDEDGDYTHRDSEECLYRVPYYEVRMEAKMIDVRSGDVLWVGSARQTSLDVLKESWSAKLNEDCNVEEQGPFIYGDQLRTEDSLDRTVTGLVSRMLSPMKEAALAGAPLDPPPAPKVVEKKPEPPAKKMATVSSNRANLREAAGARKKRITTVPRKAKVEVLETMGEWHKIKVQDGKVGWMHEDSLILSD